MGLICCVPYGRSPAESIYLFDQRLARAGISYQADLEGAGYCAQFIIRVSAAHAAVVRAVIAQLQQR